MVEQDEPNTSTLDKNPLASKALVVLGLLGVVLSVAMVVVLQWPLAFLLICAGTATVTVLVMKFWAWVGKKA